MYFGLSESPPESRKQRFWRGARTASAISLSVIIVVIATAALIWLIANSLGQFMQEHS